MYVLILFLVCLAGVSPVMAQTDTTAFYKGVRARAHYGFIFAHSESVQNTAGSHPRGVELDLISQKTDTSTWDLCHCYPVKGWSLAYFDFDTKILGRGLTGSYFLEPSYRIGNKGQFAFRGSIGLGYLSNPHHSQKNPTNLSYSTAMSAFLQLGLSGSFQVAPRWLLQFGAQYQHVSNAGFKDPNKGINWPTASVGVAWYQKRYYLPVYNRRGAVNFKKQPAYVDAGLFLSAKQGYKQGGGSPRTPLGGVVVQLEKHVGRISALNVGIEAYYDNALNQRLQLDSIDASALRAGLLGGHNFLLGKFLFSQQLGVYLYNRTPYYDRLYHRWVLRYMLHSKSSVGLGFKAHRQVADFFDLRFMYRL